jgi:glycosyltransferase involved in cell wall biosynthesis
MRVLHVLDAAAARPTDYGRRTRALLAELRTQGVQTVHLAGPERAAGAGPAAADVAHPAADGWPHHAWHLYRTTLSSPRAPGRAWLPSRWQDAMGTATLGLRLRQVAALTRPDLIHVHAPSAYAAAAWPVARLGRLPLVVDADRRAVGGHGARSLARIGCVRADALAAPSLEMRAALRANGVRPGRIAVVPPAADVAPLPRTDPAPPGLVDAPLLAFAGEPDADGGIDLLLDVLCALRRRHRALRLVVAGGGERTAWVDGRIAAAGLGGYVCVTGSLPGRRAADVLALADVAVFPALPGSAALAPSRHLLNAMARGCAIVASDIACHRELLVHGHSAMLFAAGSAMSLVDVLAQLLGDTARLRALGHAAAHAVAATHNWTATAAGYRRLYAAVLADARARAR